VRVKSGVRLKPSLVMRRWNTDMSLRSPKFAPLAVSALTAAIVGLAGAPAKSQTGGTQAGAAVPPKIGMLPLPAATPVAPAAVQKIDPIIAPIQRARPATPGITAAMAASIKAGNTRNKKPLAQAPLKTPPSGLGAGRAAVGAKPAVAAGKPVSKLAAVKAALTSPLKAALKAVAPKRGAPAAKATQAKAGPVKAGQVKSPSAAAAGPPTAALAAATTKPAAAKPLR
jgi:hypothetical protein